MPLSSFEYSEAEWSASASHYPLRDLEGEDLALIHRHWMWANQMREALDQAILQSPELEPSEAMLATRGFGFMFVWYAMLWAVIEACLDPNEGRNIDLRGPFRADIDEVTHTLRRFRNAILHIPRAGQYIDARLNALVRQPESAVLLRRIHGGFGRLFLEEFRRRTLKQHAS